MKDMEKEMQKVEKGIYKLKVIRVAEHCRPITERSKSIESTVFNTESSIY